MSVTSYNVTAGEDFATIAALSGETKVIFSFTPNLIAVKATGDDAYITVARFAGAQSGDDGVRTIASGESTTLEPYNGDKFVYVNGTGGVEVWAGRAGEEIPPSFKKSVKGGESGGSTHYRGTTTTAISDGSTTNPITINGEEYTAVFGDIVVYSSSEFIFDGTAWNEIGRGVDTTPTSGSANFVTSDGIYKRTPLVRGSNGGAQMGSNTQATGSSSVAFGGGVLANQPYMLAFGQYNNPRYGDLLNIGYGQNGNNRKNIVEVNGTTTNINNSLQMNGVNLPVPYTTMPTITESMLGQVAQYLGATDANYTKGWFYEAKSDGEETPTYSWEVINFPKSGEGGDILPSGYQKLEYVRCNGDQPGFEVTYAMPSRYAHIHEIITAATSLPTSGGSDFFGSTVYHMRGYYVISNNKPYITYDYGNVNFMKDYNTEYDTPTILSVMPDNQNGAQGTLTIGYSTLGSRPFTGRIYSYKVYKLIGAETTISNSYYYNFIPCKRLSDNKIGFYETVNGEFYSSTTTGAEFLAPSQS